MKTIEASDLSAIISKVFKLESPIDFDVPIMESGLPLESMRIVRVLAEVEKLIDTDIDQEDAFELFSLSINELVGRLNELKSGSIS
jgi:hypothetical protein